jgi:hypothetical protein
MIVKFSSGDEETKFSWRGHRECKTTSRVLQNASRACIIGLSNPPTNQRSKQSTNRPTDHTTKQADNKPKQQTQLTNQAANQKKQAATQPNQRNEKNNQPSN